MNAELDRAGIGVRFSEALEITRMQQNEIAELIDTTNSGVNSYMKGRAVPRAEIILKLMERFPHINWFYVIFGEKYGSILSPMPISPDAKKDEVIDDLKKEMARMSHIIELQEKLIKRLEE